MFNTSSKCNLLCRVGIANSRYKLRLLVENININTFSPIIFFKKTRCRPSQVLNDFPCQLYNEYNIATYMCIRELIALFFKEEKSQHYLRDSNPRPTDCKSSCDTIIPLILEKMSGLGTVVVDKINFPFSFNFNTDEFTEL